MLRKVLLILSGNAFGALMLLARNLIIARLLSLEDFGIAATFAISLSIVEMASGLGLQQLIVQDRDGGTPRLQSSLQGFNLVRGLLSGVALFCLAGPIAQFLGIPEVTWAYQVMAIVPVLRGFEHFDIHRLNRDMQFGPLMVTKTLPPLAALLAVWPLYSVFQDYRVMLYSILVQWGLTIATSHLVARRGFRLGFERSIIAKSLSFGWPLLINSVLMFLVFQGDKLIVGRELGMAELALFSMGVTLTLTPTLVSAASESAFFLPQLSARREDKARFQPLAHACMQTSLLSGMLLVLAITGVGGPLVQILLGDKYAPLIALLPWLAVWQATRAFKVGNTIVALSLAQTSNAMIANGARALVLPVAWWVLLQGGSVMQIIWVATAGELLAYVVSLWLILRQAGLPVRALVLPLAGSALVLVGAGLLFSATVANSAAFWGGWGALALLAAGTISCMKDLRGYIRNRELFTTKEPDQT